MVKLLTTLLSGDFESPPGDTQRYWMESLGGPGGADVAQNQPTLGSYCSCVSNGQVWEIMGHIRRSLKTEKFSCLTLK